MGFQDCESFSKIFKRRSKHLVSLATPQPHAVMQPPAIITLESSPGRYTHNTHPHKNTPKTAEIVCPVRQSPKNRRSIFRKIRTYPTNNRPVFKMATDKSVKMFSFRFYNSLLVAVTNSQQ